MTGATWETVARRETGSDIRTDLIGEADEQGSVLGLGVSLLLKAIWHVTDDAVGVCRRMRTGVGLCDVPLWSLRRRGMWSGGLLRVQRLLQPGLRRLRPTLDAVSGSLQAALR